MNVSKKFLYILLFGFIIVLGSSYADNVSATSSGMTTVSLPQATYFCANNACNDYNYVHFHVKDYVVGSGSSPVLNIYSDNSRVIQYNLYTFGNYNTLYTDFYYVLSQDSTFNASLNFLGNSGFGSGSTLEYELLTSLGASVPSGTLNITSNGSYDVSSYGTAVVEVPNEENSQFMGVVIDSFWQYHVAFASASVGIIVIFLVYRIIKGRLR